MTSPITQSQYESLTQLVKQHTKFRTNSTINAIDNLYPVKWIGYRLHNIPTLVDAKSFVDHIVLTYQSKYSTINVPVWLIT